VFRAISCDVFKAIVKHASLGRLAGVQYVLAPPQPPSLATLPAASQTFGLPQTSSQIAISPPLPSLSSPPASRLASQLTRSRSAPSLFLSTKTLGLGLVRIFRPATASILRRTRLIRTRNSNCWELWCAEGSYHHQRTRRALDRTRTRKVWI